MKTIAIIQARMGSTRLPGKAMADLAGMPVIQWVVRAAQAADLVDEVWVATPDAQIYEWAISNDVNSHLGSEHDVWSRFKEICERSDPDLVVRLTADCPFIDPWLITACIDRGREGCATTENWPDGMDVQCIWAGMLDVCGHREHVIDPKWNLPQLKGPPEGRVRVTVDTEEDLVRARAIAFQLPKDRPPHWHETLNALRKLQKAA